MTLTVNNSTIHFVEAGSRGGLPVVFLHGFPFSHAMWIAQLDVISSFCHAIAYDIKGHGMSDVGDGQYSIESHVDDLIGLLDLLTIDRAVIVGLSMGGYIALRALQRNPDRFKAAVLCDTRSETDTNEGRLRRFAGMKMVKLEGSKVFADNFVKAVFSPESFERNPGAVKLIHRIIEKTPPLSIAGTLLALASRTDTTESLQNIGVPTMILVGEKDTLTPPEASRAMHERIRGSELHIISRAAHMSNLENPEEFNGRLVGFLKRLGNQKSV
jgi:pimeloyl-ACP methyl ester carboxylesterase